MLKRMVGLFVLVAVTGSLAWTNCPPLRTWALTMWKSRTAWSEEDRRADPVGFITYAERKTQDDLAVMEKTRRELASKVGELAKASREKTALAAQAKTMAEEFRAEYQHALVNDSFPIEVRGKAYTEAEVKRQVSLLLAEAEGCSESLADIENMQAEAERKMEDLAVRIGQSESQLATLATKRELFKVQELTTEGETLLAQVDELMTGNSQAIADTPVRTVRELADAEQNKPKGRATNETVEEFLSDVQADQPVADEVDETDAFLTIPTSYRGQSQLHDASQGKERPQEKPKSKGQKPIFQQS